MEIYYKQLFGKSKTCSSIVKIICWIENEVLLQDIRTGLRYVIASSDFMNHHEDMIYECDYSTYAGSDLDKIL